MGSRCIGYTLPFLLCIMLQACGGGGGGGSTAALPSTTVYGVAATGLAVNGTVTLKDATGATRSATISQPSGAFTIDVAGLKPPYFLKATDSSGATSLYSIAYAVGNFNINPISTLVVVAAAMNVDPLATSPDAAFNDPALFANLTPEDIRAAVASVMAQMSAGFKAGLAANGATGVNPLTDPFQVGKGLDKVFDNFVVTLDTATGELRERQVATNTTSVLGLVDRIGTFPAPGIYDGTVVNPLALGPRGGLVRDMMITPAGQMRYVMEDGVQVVARLVASGSTVTGKGRAYAPTLNGQPTNFQFPNGLKVMDVAINGTLGAGTFSGTQTYGTFNLAFSFALNALQSRAPASLAKIAGTYVASTAGNRVFIGHIEPNGRIWGSGPAFAYSGLVQVIDPDLNIYRVTLAYLKNSTFGYVSGLATFHDTWPADVVLSMPTTIVPAGYTADVANLTYSQSASGNTGMLAILLSSPLQQISLEAVRVSSLQQTIAARPAPASLMVQAVGNPAFSVRAAGDIQYSGSAETIVFSGFLSSSAGNVNIVANPGNIALSGPDEVAIPLPYSIALTIPSTPQDLAAIQLPPNSVIGWQSFNISPDTSISFVPSSGSPALNNVSVSPGQIVGMLESNSQIYLLDPNTTPMSSAGLSLKGSISTAGTGETVGGTTSTLEIATTPQSGCINLLATPSTLPILSCTATITATTVLNIGNAATLTGVNGAQIGFGAVNNAGCSRCVTLYSATAGAGVKLGTSGGIYASGGVSLNGSVWSADAGSVYIGSIPVLNGTITGITGTNTIVTLSGGVSTAGGNLTVATGRISGTSSTGVAGGGTGTTAPAVLTLTGNTLSGGVHGTIAIGTTNLAVSSGGTTLTGATITISSSGGT